VIVASSKPQPRKSLAETHPELAAQADGWDPSLIRAGNGKKVRWRCSLGHEFFAVIANRAVLGSGCPFCSGRKVLTGFNDLATKYPSLAAEADGWDPSGFTYGSGKRVNWRCAKGHCWSTTINARTSSESGCPTCSGRKVASGENDLATTHPQIAHQADGWDPRTVTSGSNRVRKWKCQKGHTWMGSVKSRSRGGGCPVCYNAEIVVGINDLRTTHPEIAAQASGWDPTTLTFGSDKKRQWKCDVGHVWTAVVKSRSKGGGCPICSGQRVLSGFNDLASTHPDLAAQAHGWDPTTRSAGSRSKVSWQCESKHIFQAVISSRTGQQSGCPICSGRQVLQGFNDLATTHPDLAEQADGWDPRTVSFGSNQLVKWKGRCGHHWTMRVAKRGSSGQRCPYCASKKVLVGFNDLASTHPELARQAHNWDPTTLTFASGKKVHWICERSHIWKTTVASRGFSSNSCPTCSGQKVLAGFNDLATTHPAIAAQAVGWDPKTVSRGSKQRLLWECQVGHQWKTAPSARTGGDKTGCPSCAKFGFDPNSDAWIYFLLNDELGYLQIGITNKPKNRLDDHRRKGFELIELRGPMEGLLAKQLESQMLHILNKKSARFVNKAKGKKFSGWSETWTKKSLNVTSIKQILDWVYEDESK
jgi:hypothetical protein